MAGAFIPLTHVNRHQNHYFLKTNVFFYWQLLIILFADDRAKKLWNYTSLCYEKGKIHFWHSHAARSIHVIPPALCGRLPDFNPISRAGNAIFRIMEFAIMIFSQATIFTAMGTLHF